MFKMYLSALLLILLANTACAQNESKNIVPKAAKVWNKPAGMMLVDITRAGNRLVAVGEHGVVILSDDGGKTFRQAKTMPVDSTLTAVTFTDAKNGWAVGHWGVIVMTDNGGETWQLQHVDSSVDQPLFSVAFKDANEGWAVGLWSMLLHTKDGGKNWVVEHLQAPVGSTTADKNLNKIFMDRNGIIYIAGESGIVLRSTDNGVNWVYLNTGYVGSFWTGLVADNGAIYVAGLRGSLYRSEDGGSSWKSLESGSKASITGLTENDKKLAGVALDGYSFSGNIEASAFVSTQSATRSSYTGLVANNNGQFVIVSKEGIVLK